MSISKSKFESEVAGTADITQSPAYSIQVSIDYLSEQSLREAKECLQESADYLKALDRCSQRFLRENVRTIQTLSRIFW